ncbi:MAG: hypothetical protein HYY24_13445 [Verrucomicrobia bacterium]|nr:hypothetical protein [Verrucomicrobiota bacterium]
MENRLVTQDKQDKPARPTEAILRPRVRWLNRTVLGIGLASLFSDWSHEIATAVMPAFLATMGVAAAWLSTIKGGSDRRSSFAKMGSGCYSADKLRRRKLITVTGYLVTAVGTAAFGQATAAWHVLLAEAVAKPRIIIFDEATSALDNRTQAIVSRSLEELQATRIIIAHRLSTIIHADRIFVMQAGRLVQSGNYEDLMAQAGPFAELAQRQLA